MRVIWVINEKYVRGMCHGGAFGVGELVSGRVRYGLTLGRAGTGDWGQMVTLMRRRGRRRGAHKTRTPTLGAAAIEYAALGWPVCLGAHPSRGIDGTIEM